MSRSSLLVCLLVGLQVACRDPAPAPASAAAPVSAAPPRVLSSRRLPEQLSSSAAAGGDGKLHVYFLDVGQGEATLILAPSGRSVLVDAGPPSGANALVQRLRQLLTAPVDLVLLTADDPEHLGGLGNVLGAIGFRRLLAPSTWHPRPQLAEDLAAHQVELLAPPLTRPEDPPERVSLGGGADLWVLWPTGEEAQRDAAENTLVTRISFGATSVLFTGDLPGPVEQVLLTSGRELTSTLLQVAAHGDADSSTAPFLGAVQPLAAVISCGAGNARGYPARPVTERLEALSARVFRTDLDGELDAVSDGSRFRVTASKPAAGEPSGVVHAFPPDSASIPRPPPRAAPLKSNPRPGQPPPQATAATTHPTPSREPPASPTRGFLASKNGDVFHRPDCRAAKRILPKNLVRFDNREQALKERRPASDCKP